MQLPSHDGLITTHLAIPPKTQWVDQYTLQPFTTNSTRHSTCDIFFKLLDNSQAVAPHSVPTQSTTTAGTLQSPSWLVSFTPLAGWAAASTLISAQQALSVIAEVHLEWQNPRHHCQRAAAQQQYLQTKTCWQSRQQEGRIAATKGST